MFIAGSLDPCGFIVQQLCAILHSQSEAITIKVIDVQQQTGCSDCGLFALAFAADLVENKDPFTRSYFQSKLRGHLNKCFDAEKISTFPSRSRRVPEKRTADISVINVYCVCRQPERLPMACCDQCLEWYHSECVTIPDEIFSDMGKKWFCRRHAETTQGVTGVHIIPHTCTIRRAFPPHSLCLFSLRDHWPW